MLSLVHTLIFPSVTSAASRRQYFAFLYSALFLGYACTNLPFCILFWSRKEYRKVNWCTVPRLCMHQFTFLYSFLLQKIGGESTALNCQKIFFVFTHLNIRVTNLNIQVSKKIKNLKKNYFFFLRNTFEENFYFDFLLT